jgi:hypothetical protein
LTTWLVFFVLDCMQACSKHIRSLKSSEADWSLSAVQHLLDEWKVRLEEISLLVTVRLIAEHTNAVMKIIYYPFALVLLMLLARSPLFDYLNLPLPLIILSSLLLAALLLSAYSVRSAAHEAREEVLSRMRGMLTAAMADEASSSRVEQLKQLIDEIRREQRGAYGPMARGPIVGSLALFFGGSGGLLLIQRYLPALIF